MLAVNMRESASTVKKFAKAEKAPFPMLLDVDGDITYNYGVRGAPAHIMIDGRGNIAGAAMGAIDWDRVDGAKLIRHLLENNDNS